MPLRRLLFASMLLAGCGTEAPAPAKPTWAEDVLPILRANCFGCHGPLANYRKFQNKRWDVYDMNAEPLMRMGLGPISEDFEINGVLKPIPVFFSATENATSFVAFTGPLAVEATRMPPPPATPLSARDVEVLKNWNDTGKTLGSHSPNHKAAYRWLDKPARLVAVTDEDGDQVLGKLDCEGMEVVILRSGSHKLPSTVCTGTLFDGFDETTVNLK